MSRSGHYKLYIDEEMIELSVKIWGKPFVDNILNSKNGDIKIWFKTQWTRFRKWRKLRKARKNCKDYIYPFF